MHDQAGDPGSPALSRWLQSVLMVLFCVVAAFYSIAIPPGEGVDEISHFDYVHSSRKTEHCPCSP